MYVHHLTLTEYREYRDAEDRCLLEDGHMRFLSHRALGRLGKPSFAVHLSVPTDGSTHATVQLILAGMHVKFHMYFETKGKKKAWVWTPAKRRHGEWSSRLFGLLAQESVSTVPEVWLADVFPVGVLLTLRETTERAGGCLSESLRAQFILRLNVSIERRPALLERLKEVTLVKAAKYISFLADEWEQHTTARDHA